MRKRGEEPCIRADCENPVPEKDYLTWLVPPLRDGDIVWRPACSAYCANKVRTFASQRRRR